MAKKKKSTKKTQQKQAATTSPKRSSWPWILAAVCVVAVIFVAVLWPKGEEASQTDADAAFATETTAETDSSDSTEDIAGGSTENDDEEETAEADDLTATAQEKAQQEARAKLASGVTYYADIIIENYGTVTVQLAADEAPITVLNFVSLAGSGFYDGLTFHRIISGFMMQGGDPLGNGTGGSEDRIEGEFTSNGYDNTLSHTRGAISMARSSDYNSASSQFFIVHEDSTYLDGDYAVFGYVTEGMDVVDAICEAAEPTDSNGTIPADQQPVIQAIAIRMEPAA